MSRPAGDIQKGCGVINQNTIKIVKHTVHTITDTVKQRLMASPLNIVRRKLKKVCSLGI